MDGPVYAPPRARTAMRAQLATQFADLSPLALTVSDPLTATEVQTIADRLDLILARLQT